MRAQPWHVALQLAFHILAGHVRQAPVLEGSGPESHVAHKAEQVFWQKWPYRFEAQVVHCPSPPTSSLHVPPTQFAAHGVHSEPQWFASQAVQWPSP
jgi:hypothetical protein